MIGRLEVLEMISTIRDVEQTVKSPFLIGFCNVNLVSNPNTLLHIGSGFACQNHQDLTTAERHLAYWIGHHCNDLPQNSSEKILLRFNRSPVLPPS